MTQHSSAPSKRLGEKVFTERDQRNFAQASRDINPMHVDAVAARRLLSGRQVVHGIHTLIHALELWSAGMARGRVRASCQFANPVNVGDAVVFSCIEESDGRTRILAAVDGLICTEVAVQTLTDSDVAKVTPFNDESSRARRQIGKLSAALDEVPGSQVGSLIVMPTWSDDLAQQFPHAAALLGRHALTAVAQLSYFVGMVCPGLHSVFSSVQFDTGQAPGDALLLDVRKYDPRFRLFTAAFAGAVRGELRAFLRPPPQPQPLAREVAARLEGNEFKDTRSLVIGGSRGLGETTAKLLAAGGGDVWVSYALGQSDAQAVADDINGVGRGRCAILPLDLSVAFDGLPSTAPQHLDAVYFFATPRIYAKRSEVFHRGAFDEFVGFYLQRFYELCRWLNKAERDPPIKVYLPSTVFIAERPKGMTEYAMAKAAAEVLAEDINRNMVNLRVVHTRLPRLATDQTASILQVASESNLDVLLSVVREINS